MQKNASQLEKIREKFWIVHLPLMCLSAAAIWGACYVFAGGSLLPWAASLVPFLVGAFQRSTDKNSYSWRISTAFLVLSPLLLLAVVMAYGFLVDAKSAEDSAAYMMFFSVIAFAGVIQLLIYFTPSLIARKRSNFSKVFIINLLAGWTVIGWFVALYFAFKGDASRKPSVAENAHKDVS